MGVTGPPVLVSSRRGPVADCVVAAMLLVSYCYNPISSCITRSSAEPLSSSSSLTLHCTTFSSVSIFKIEYSPSIGISQ